MNKQSKVKSAGQWVWCDNFGCNYILSVLHLEVKLLLYTNCIYCISFGGYFFVACICKFWNKAYIRSEVKPYRYSKAVKMAESVNIYVYFNEIYLYMKSREKNKAAIAGEIAEKTQKKIVYRRKGSLSDIPPSKKI